MENFSGWCRLCQNWLSETSFCQRPCKYCWRMRVKFKFTWLKRNLGDNFLFRFLLVIFQVLFVLDGSLHAHGDLFAVGNWCGTERGNVRLVDVIDDDWRRSQYLQGRKKIIQISLEVCESQSQDSSKPHANQTKLKSIQFFCFCLSSLTSPEIVVMTAIMMTVNRR